MNFTNEERQRLYNDLLEEGLLLEEVAFSVRNNVLPASDMKKMFDEHRQRTKETFKTLSEYLKEKGKTENENDY